MGIWVISQIMQSEVGLADLHIIMHGRARESCWDPALFLYIELEFFFVSWSGEMLQAKRLELSAYIVAVQRVRRLFFRQSLEKTQTFWAVRQKHWMLQNDLWNRAGS